MIILNGSHTDHVSKAILDHIVEVFKDRDAFFIETIELPTSLPELENALYGPSCGDPPVADSEVTFRRRPGREYESRAVDRPTRPTRTCTVIAGPYQGEACVLYTVFGGPASPREVNDPTLPEADREASVRFWAEHALAVR